MKMANSKTTKELLETYYKGFAKKEGWETVLSDDFKYTGGDMDNRVPTNEKSQYIAVVNRFSRVFQDMRVKEMIVDGDNACVIGNYDYRFPNGKELNGDVAEIWTAKDGELTSLTVFFDTRTFDENTPKPNN